jgi:hypothetical protein
LLEASAPFARSAYLHMEKWLRDRGDEDTADQVYREMRRRSRREPGPGQSPTSPTWLLGEPWRFLEWLFLDVLVGYGTQSGRTGVAFLLLVALSTWLFLPREAVEDGHTSEAQPGAVGAVGAEEVYKPLDAFWVALQLNLPVVKLPAAEKWKPSDRPLWTIGPVTIRYHDYASGAAFLSWIIVPLFLGSVSGVIKKQG